MTPAADPNHGTGYRELAPWRLTSCGTRTMMFVKGRNCWTIGSADPAKRTRRSPRKFHSALSHSILGRRRNSAPILGTPRPTAIADLKLCPFTGRLMPKSSKPWASDDMWPKSIHADVIRAATEHAEKQCSLALSAPWHAMANSNSRYRILGSAYGNPRFAVVCERPFCIRTKGVLTCFHKRR